MYKNQPENTDLIIAYIIFFGAISIASSSYLGLYGDHTWRQADVYSHILGFIESSEFRPFDSFTNGSRSVFDIPIYQWCIAKLSSVTDIEPLVICRLMNLACWIITTTSGIKIINLYENNKTSSIVFLLFMINSSLFIHYFSVPLPDILSLSLCTVALYKILSRSPNCYTISFILFLIATLIKSPISFTFCIYYIFLMIIDDRKKDEEYSYIFLSYKNIIYFCSLGIIALFSEYLRKILINDYQVGFAQNPLWYFGELRLRASKEFWYFFLKNSNEIYLGIFLYLATTISTLCFIFSKRKENKALILASIGSFLISWLVFSNVYYRHNYYLLPSAYLLFISLAIASGELAKRAVLSVKIINTYKYQILFTAIFISSVILLKLTFNNSKTRVNQFNAMEYLLKNKSIISVVENSHPNDPTLGGLLSKKIEMVKIEVFEENCLEFIKNKQALLIKHESNCLESNENKNIFKYLINRNNTKLIERIIINDKNQHE